MKIRKAVIPAAGLGKRLLPLTRSLPKEMLPIGQKPVIQHVVDEIQLAGVEHILVITNQDKRSIEDHLNNSKSLPGEVFYMRQTLGSDLPYGLAYAVGLSEAFVGDEPFIVCLGDCIIKPEGSLHANTLLKRMIHTHETHKAAATIAFEEAQHPSHGNAFYLYKDGTREVEVVGKDVMTQNGHCTYLPGNEWILNDTYPSKERKQEVYLYNVARSERITLGHFYTAPEYQGEWRCDTHPRFSPDGRSATIDSPHEGDGRQIHLIDISKIA